jgi:hypothetical protein
MPKGHLNYFAASGNHPSLWWFFNKVKRLWLASRKRRGQTARLNRERFIRFVARFFGQSERYTRCPVAASTPEPEGGARCVGSAGRDPCGGREILVPTATLNYKRRKPAAADFAISRVICITVRHASVGFP